MGEFSLTAIVLLVLGLGVGIAVYHDPRLGVAIGSAVAVVTVVYALMRKTSSSIDKDNEGKGGPPTPSN